MDNNKAEKKMHKKIERLLKSIAYDGNCEKIIKEFGSINYQYNGDSLYHLITKRDTDFEQQVINIIYFLIDAGLDINIRNNEGKTFFQSSDSDIKKSQYVIEQLPLDKMDLNNQDNEGKTILHNLVDELSNIVSLTRIYDALEEYVDASIKDNNGKTFLDLAETKFMFEKYNGWFLSLRRTFYEKNFDCFIDIINDDNMNLDYFFNLLFIGSAKTCILYWCQENEYANEEDKLNAIEKLFALNIDPNDFGEHDNSIVIEAINNGYSMEYILKLYEICLDHGYDLNDFSKIIKCWAINDKTIGDLTDVYALSAKYGYNKLNDDIKYCYHVLTPEVIENLCLTIKNNGFVKMLDSLLKEYGLIGEQKCSLDKDVLNDIFEVQNLIESSLEIKNDYGMAKLLVEKIIQNRENNINIIGDNTVSVKEVTDALKSVLEEYVSNVVKPTTKILSKYS